MKTRSSVLALAVGIAVATTVMPSLSQAETVKLAHSTWVGYGPLYIAQEKGFFKKHGVDVELVIMEEPKDRFPAMLAGKIDMIASTVDTAILYLRKPDEFQYVVAIDDSNGGDGIVAKKDIRSLADLKGKTVAFSEGSVSEFYLNVLLAKAGLKASDLTPVNMAAPEAGAAFVANKVDAAVTWEPWLSRGKQAEFGHLLVDSSTSPGLITDVVIATKDYVAKHGAETKAVVAAWNEAVAFQRAHADEANAIMAKGVGGWLKSPKDFKETLPGIKFYGRDDNKAFFGTKDKPGPLHRTVEDAITIWSGQGRLQVQTGPDKLIDYEFVTQ